MTRQGGWQQPDWGYMAPGDRTLQNEGHLELNNPQHPIGDRVGHRLDRPFLDVKATDGGISGLSLKVLNPAISSTRDIESKSRGWTEENE